MEALKKVLGCVTESTFAWKSWNCSHNAGLLRAGGHAWGNLAEVPLNTQVKALAVTIEPAGGMPQLTDPTTPESGKTAFSFAAALAGSGKVAVPTTGGLP